MESGLINISRFKTRLAGALDLTDPSHRTFFDRVSELAAATPAEKVWSRYRNFWPPALLDALRNERLVAFMGAGVSVASKLPGWRDLLEKHLGVPSEFLDDDYLKSDNLTLGEISARLLGREQLQHSLRSIYNSTSANPTLIHYALAALGLPIYITTNYDDLFEKAWKSIYQQDIAVVCNASDAISCVKSPHKIYKIHGSANRLDEMLVLTRSDYRKHYRANDAMFSEIGKHLLIRPTLFTGFSHTDPEVGRLIDSVIYEFERQRSTGSILDGPSFYNMQFENTYVVNERFAAKGMVSLTVRMAEGAVADVRTGGVASSLAELADATGNEMDLVTSLDADLANFVTAVSGSFKAAIEALRPAAEVIGNSASGRDLDKSVVKTALAGVDLAAALGTQGIYVIDADGALVEDRGALVGRRYDGLDSTARDKILSGIRSSFSERPYFQMANTIRKPFVSDLFESIFNRNSSFAICHPILSGHRFVGLVFSVTQVGQWMTPLDFAGSITDNLGVYLFDSQGVVAMPPNNEFSPQPSTYLPSEPVACNLGFSHSALRLLSRKDRIILRLSENIVPIEKDDDVLSLDKRLDVYARVQTVAGFDGWRCAITRTIEFTP